MGFEQVLLFVSTCGLLVALWIIGDPRQLSALTQEVSELKLQITNERDKRIAFETSLNNLKIDYKILENEMNKEYDTLHKRVTANTSIKRQVAFSARLGKSYEDIAPWETIVFSDVLTNIGNAYNNNNGKFTAPIEGLYVFYSHILTKDNNIETCLQVNGGNKMFLYSPGKFHGHGSGCNEIVIHLNIGDEVKMVKHGPFGDRPFYIHHVWSTFSGFLL